MTRAQASRLLRLNRHYPRWVSAVAPADQEVLAFLRRHLGGNRIRRCAPL
jgi:hypothetical protein